MTKTELEWGHTPWDGMSREELLREVQRMYSALLTLYSGVNTQRGIDEEFYKRNLPYWSKSGAGGASWEKARQIIEPLREKYGEDIYRAFFRYADDLLFTHNGYEMIGAKWVTCDTCGVMFGSVKGEEYADVGKPCKWGKANGEECTGHMRKLEWADLAPKSPEPAPASGT